MIRLVFIFCIAVFIAPPARPLIAQTTSPSDGPEAKAKVQVLFDRAEEAVIARSSVALEEVEEFIQSAPGDERGSTLLFQMSNRESDPKKQTEFFQRIIKTFPHTPAADTAAGSIRRVNGIGKPFDLIFTDLISGKQISVQRDLKGKIVVIDFWATWCSDCIAEMPHEKELYARYKDKGVEFIGVSADEPEAQGGLKALKGFIAANGITWPQYYQGNAELSLFSTSWGIEAFPTMFIVGPDGNLSSISAQGRLDTLIPQMLAKRDASAPK